LKERLIMPKDTLLHVAELLEEAARELKDFVQVNVGEKEEKEEKKVSEYQFPLPEALEEMGKTEIAEIAESVGINPEGKKLAELKTLLSTVHYIGCDRIKKVAPEEVTDLCLALGLEPAKELRTNIENIKDYFSASEDEAHQDQAETMSEKVKGEEEEESKEKEEKEEEEEEEEEEESKTKEPSKPAKKKTIDYEAIASEAELPAKEEMLSRLTDFNKEADEDEIIDPSAGLKKAYRRLLIRLVDNKGKLMGWEEPYGREGEGWCCAFSLKDYLVKGDDREFGKCRICDQVYYLDEEGDFNVYEE
jgi:hypothetical protein